jgi:hypothetical protein
MAKRSGRKNKPPALGSERYPGTVKLAAGWVA